MDSPSLPPNPTIAMASVSTTTTVTTTGNYPDSSTSSPRSHQNDTWDEPLPTIPITKLRLMCSYGGHIIPSPYDKSLCYIGGDTRIIVVDRNLPLSEFHSRLSRSMLNGRAFMLKYQLPNEDLDSLVSVTNDDDLENMIDEYDRVNSSSLLKPSRLRLFLFPFKPDTAVSMGSLLDDAKSETWFVDALNDSGLKIPRGLSDSAANNNLLELEDQILTKTESPPTNQTGDVQETNSSFESISELPPIKVRDEEGNQRVLFYDQFSQMNVGSNVQRHEDGSMNVAATQLPPLPTFPLPTGSKKPPLPLHPVQLKVGDAYNLPSPDSKNTGGYNLPSPDSVASDSSIASSAASMAKYANYPEGSPNPTANIVNNNVSDSVIEPQNNIPAPSSHIQFQPVYDAAMAPPLTQQQQHIQPTVHYIQHPPTNPQQIPSYYPIYAPHPSQAFQQTTDQQQYPMYLLPTTTTQTQFFDSSSTATNQPLTPVIPSIIPSSATYNEIRAPIYPSNYYRQAVTANPALVHVPSSQFQQQYFNQSQMQQPPPAPQTFSDNSNSNAGYGYEYGQPMNDHAYYGQQFTNTPIAQYQTMATNPATAVMFTQTPTNLSPENIDQQAGNPQ